VAAIGVAQEFQRVWTAYEGKTSTGTPRWSFATTDRRVTCYYFYLWDQDFGPAFIKVCAWFPYPPTMPAPTRRSRHRSCNWSSVNRGWR
jgi:hypothetical protein